MNSIRIMFIALSMLLIGGCSGVVKMMPRDSGSTYSGVLEGCWGGSCTMSINMDGDMYTGIVVKATSNEMVGFSNQFGTNGSSFKSFVADGGTTVVQGILSSTNGKGLRCQFTATGNGGAGVCIDDKKRILDAVVYR